MAHERDDAADERSDERSHERDGRGHEHADRAFEREEEHRAPGDDGSSESRSEREPDPAIAIPVHESSDNLHIFFPVTFFVDFLHDCI